MFSISISGDWNVCLLGFLHILTPKWIKTYERKNFKNWLVSFNGAFSETGSGFRKFSMHWYFNSAFCCSWEIRIGITCKCCVCISITDIEKQKKWKFEVSCTFRSIRIQCLDRMLPWADGTCLNQLWLFFWLACHWYVYYILHHLKSITENSRWRNTKLFYLRPFWSNIPQYKLPRYHFSLKLCKYIYFRLNWMLWTVMCYSESLCQCFMSCVLK